MVGNSSAHRALDLIETPGSDQKVARAQVYALLALTDTVGELADGLQAVAQALDSIANALPGTP